MRPLRISAARSVVVLAFIVSNIGAQEATPVFRTNSRLVLLDVVVTDKAGRAIRGLGKADFTVLEDGLIQPILSVEAPGQLASESSHSSAARTIILLDQLNIRFQELAYARDEIAKFLKQHDAEQQPTALMTIGRQGLATVQDFTQHNNVIEKRLAELPVLLANPVDGYADSALAGEHAQEALHALAQLARAAVGYPFRVNVVWITSGFPGALQDANSTGEVSSGLRNIANLLIRSRMCLYTIDPSGVMAIGEAQALNRSGGRGRKAMHDGVAQFNGPQNDRQLTADQLLGEMTHLMGGVSYFNRNDIDRALSQAIEDGSSAYAVTYSPSNADFQGSYRRIEVRVAGEVVLARTRPGYYATPQGSSSLSQTRDDLLSAALDNPSPTSRFV